MLHINPQNRLAKLWLYFAISSLTFAGVFSIIIVFARTPIIKDLLPFHNLFANSLVVHVNFSQLFWMLSISMMLLSSLDKTNARFSITNFRLALIGAVFIAISPFLPNAQPILNNYIPVINHLFFFIGLAFFFTALLLENIIALANSRKYYANSEKWIIFSNSPIIIISLLCMILTYRQIPISETGHDFYETLFWGGGHLLQFAYSNLLLIAFLLISPSLGINLKPKQAFIKLCFSLNILIAAIGLLYFTTGDSSLSNYFNFYTKHMIIAGGIIPLIVFLLLFTTFLKRQTIPKSNFAVKSCLGFSLLLFLSGGFIGFLIREINTTVPAHYHGSTVGITIALMGLIYHLLPKFGFNEVKGRLAKIQPFFYGGGQILHITGLAFSGGYGALRKDPTAIYDFKVRVWMGLMGMGGLLAMIGGLLFVIICYKSIRGKNA
jgi:hypothetical protein